MTSDVTFKTCWLLFYLTLTQAFSNPLGMLSGQLPPLQHCCLHIQAFLFNLTDPLCHIFLMILSSCVKFNARPIVHSPALVVITEFLWLWLPVVFHDWTSSSAGRPQAQLRHTFPTRGKLTPSSPRGSPEPPSPDTSLLPWVAICNEKVTVYWIHINKNYK